MHQENFIRFIRFEKRYSPHTVLAYDEDISQFNEFILNVYGTDSIEQVNHQMIRAWIIQMGNENITTRTINRKLSALKTYYKYLLKEQIITLNPFLKIITPKTSKQLPEFLVEDQMEDLFTLSDFENNIKGTRDKLIIEMFYCTGIRLSELVNLNDSDIDVPNQKIKVLGKRNKERIIPIINSLCNSITQYREFRNQMISDESNVTSFFLTDKGKKIYEKLVFRIVNSYLGRVCTLRKKSPHILRHTFATHMLNNGADLNAIKELLGHANLSATQVYTHNTIDKLKSIYKQAHPRA
jgi:integrase/recombinase XerC